MLNHARTLLLNLSYESEEEHIPPNYNKRALSQDLSLLYNTLFPVSSSRNYKFFLCHNYLNLIEAAGMTSHVLAYDPRVSYSLDTTQFFKVSRETTPISSDPDYPIFVLGELQSVNNSDYTFDTFVIRQFEDQSLVSVYSRMKSKYIDPAGGDDLYSVDVATRPVTFSSSDISDEMGIGETGLSFVIGRKTGTSFTDTSYKYWEFSAETPYRVDILSIITGIENLNGMHKLKKYGVDISEYENMWNYHFNSVYKFAAFILAYVKVIDSL